MNNKKTLLILTISILLQANLSHTTPLSTGDFGLIDHNGNFHQLSKYKHKKAVVLISQANSCLENHNSMSKYKLIQTYYGDKDVAILMINSTASDRLKMIQQESSAYEINLPILLDETQLVAEKLNISKAGEILIIDPKSRQLVFRGPPDITQQAATIDHVAIKGSFFVANTLNKLISGDKINNTTTIDTTGCNISFTARDKHRKKIPDYAKDIAPIIEKNCATCHREGGIAPFAMDSYAVLRGWSAMIQEAVLTKRMPPMQVDPHVKHFDNARYLDTASQQTLLHWINAGAPKGTWDVDPLTQFSWPKDEWQLGKPDVVIQTPRTEIPATGILDYIEINMALPFENDVWIKSIQFIPENKKVLHHMVSQIVPKSYVLKRDGFNSSVTRFLEGYAPGKDGATTFPHDMGVFVPKGHKLNLSIHYTTTGRPESDSTRIGLYLYDTPPKHELHTKSVKHQFKDIVIPPGTHEHKMYNSHLFTEEVIIHSLRPHMHTRGKYMSFKAVYPDNRTEELLNVPNYNFNWQPTYRLSTPVQVPAGTRIVINGAFDNSNNQVGNADPTAFAHGGKQTWDEMFIGYITYSKTGAEAPAELASVITSK